MQAHGAHTPTPLCGLCPRLGPVLGDNNDSPQSLTPPAAQQEPVAAEELSPSPGAGMALQGWRCFLTVSAPTLTVNLLFLFPINIINNIQFPFCPRWSCCSQARNYLCHSIRHVLNISVLRENKYEGTSPIPAVFVEEWVHIGSIFRA